MDAAQRRIAASLHRVARELGNLRLEEEALFGFVGALAKTILTCVPEPRKEAQEQRAIAEAVSPWPRKLRANASSGFGRGGHEHRVNAKRFPGLRNQQERACARALHRSRRAVQVA